MVGKFASNKLLQRLTHYSHSNIYFTYFISDKFLATMPHFHITPEPEIEALAPER